MSEVLVEWRDAPAVNDRVVEAAPAPILTMKDHAAASVFQPASMLREARRQRGIAHGPVPRVCVLDPDGDIVHYLQRHDEVQRSQVWACYHTQMWEHGTGSDRIGFVASAVGGAFAVLIAEQLFASGCEVLMSLASAGQILDAGAPPYTILIDRSLRDEGTSYHYLPGSEFVDADPDLVDLAWQAFTSTGCAIYRGATWTTDAPFRETAAVIAARRRQGILAVEMEAASLYAFAAAAGRPVLCVAQVTNQMGCVEGDFEKGEHDGARSAMKLVLAFAVAWTARCSRFPAIDEVA